MELETFQAHVGAIPGLPKEAGKLSGGNAELAPQPPGVRRNPHARPDLPPLGGRLPFEPFEFAETVQKDGHFGMGYRSGELGGGLAGAAEDHPGSSQGQRPLQLQAAGDVEAEPLVEQEGGDPGAVVAFHREVGGAGPQGAPKGPEKGPGPAPQGLPVEEVRPMGHRQKAFPPGKKGSHEGLEDRGGEPHDPISALQRVASSAAWIPGSPGSRRAMA